MAITQGFAETIGEEEKKDFVTNKINFSYQHWNVTATKSLYPNPTRIHEKPIGRKNLNPKVRGYLSSSYYIRKINKRLSIFKNPLREPLQSKMRKISLSFFVFMESTRR